MPRPELATANSTAYTPRCPEDTVLYGVVSGNLETFLSEAERADRIVPRFVERELRTYLACGILAQGMQRTSFAFDRFLLPTMTR